MNGERSMKALVKTKREPGLEMREVPIPSIGPTDVRIAVQKVGICGTDLHIYEWDTWSAGRVPIGTIVGHEFMGVVVEVGAAVDTLRPGDRVSGEGHIGCGTCFSCRTGQSHICSKVDIIGIDIDGCFAEFIVMPAGNVWKLDDSIPDEIGALFDPLGNAMHTVMTDRVSGRNVLVVGVGTIGLLITNIARAGGAVHLAVLDPNPKKRALALELGADEAFDPLNAATEDRLMAMTREGEGFDVMLEASGSEAGIRAGLRLLRSGGWVAFLGIPKGDVSLNLAEELIFKGATFHGVNGRRMYETWYQVEDFLKSGRLKPERVITHTLPFSRFEEGFALMKRGEAIKVILDLEGQ